MVMVMVMVMMMMMVMMTMTTSRMTVMAMSSRLPTVPAQPIRPTHGVVAVHETSSGEHASDLQPRQTGRPSNY